MYKPSLLNFFPSISSQLQTLRDKKNKFSYERVLKEAVSLKAVHSISRHFFCFSCFPLFFGGEEAFSGVYTKILILGSATSQKRMESTQSDLSRPRRECFKD